MKLFDKLKNIFIEEELMDEDNITMLDKIKIDDIKEEPKAEVKEENVEEEVKPVVDDISDRSLLDTNQKFKFPIIFEDDDFIEEKKKTKTVNVLERETVKYEPEVKKEIKPTVKKSFKLSPIISPVYGVLDKNYIKEDISTRDGLLDDYDSKIDIDSVIKKAYGEAGIVEEKLESVKEETKELIDEKIEEPIMEEPDIELPEDDNAIDLFKDIEENSEHSIDEIDEKIKSIDDLLNDTTDDDFYSLVDSMYKEEEDDTE